MSAAAVKIHATRPDKPQAGDLWPSYHCPEFACPQCSKPSFVHVSNIQIEDGNVSIATTVCDSCGVQFSVDKNQVQLKAKA